MKLHKYFSNGMAIQAGKPFIVKGVGAENTCVRADLIKDGKTVLSACSTTDKDGAFTIEMLPRTASFDAYVMRVFTPFDEITLSDVVFGDVYFLTGQSNMEYVFRYQKDNAKIFNEENSPFVRYQKVPCGDVHNSPYGHIGKTTEQDDYATDSAWIYGNDFDGVLDASAVGYQFALSMIKKCNYPIGLVDASVGGSSVENWYPIEFQKTSGALKEYDDRLTLRDGFCRIGCIWCDMVYPVKDIAFKGQLWYQGCSNCFNEYDGLNYLTMFDGFISSRKKAFRYDFPLAVINLHTNFITDFGTAYVNEQLFECENFYNDCICVPQYDLPFEWNNLDGDREYHQIHPTTKRELASRTADYFYKRFILKENFATPKICKVDFCDGYAVATIDRKKISVKGNKIFGFTIAGENKKYYVAKAELLSESTVKIYHHSVNAPKYITYAFFLYNNDCNLFADGLPIAPYRTDKCTSVLDGVYAVPNQILACDKKYLNTSHYSPSYGFSKKVKTWGTGNLHPTKNKVTVTSDGVKIKYEFRPEDYYFLTAGPFQNIEGLCIPFKNYNFVSVDVVSDSQVDVIGMLVAQADGHRFMMPPSVKVLEKDVLTKLTFDLVKVGYDFWVLDFNKKDFITFDLVFRAKDKNPLTVTIKYIDFHD